MNYTENGQALDKEYFDSVCETMTMLRTNKITTLEEVLNLDFRKLPFLHKETFIQALKYEYFKRKIQKKLKETNYDIRT